MDFVERCRTALVFCLAVLLPFLVVSLSACGYHRVERSEAIPSWIKTIYIAPFSNHSNELLLGQWVTDALRREFLRGGGLALASKEDADVILEGDIVRVDTAGLSFLTYSQTIERQISAECSLRIIDRKTGQVLWQTTNLRRDEGFLVGQEPMQTEGFKEEALKELSRYMAELIYHRVTDVF
ncbi:MAG: LPS assembly lipoprotein LptE [Dissulfurimicrobium sp.]|nr:LptE family protein [Dissulfurimicrobium hydrothermale]UKL12849.1 LPS assembly lipoprotein LptE [Dissulfurimicrobium hydrothermale]